MSKDVFSWMQLKMVQVLLSYVEATRVCNLCVCRVETPVGRLFVATQKSSLCFSQFHATWSDALSALQRLYPLATIRLDEGSEELFHKDYNGTSWTVTVPGTPFQLSVWKALTHILRGCTSTYADIARQIDRPRAYRAVATACHANPVQLFVPCHRIVRSNGELGGYAAGTQLKARLLRSEGVYMFD